MDTLDKDTVSNRYAEAYAQLVKEFCEDVRTIAEKYKPISRTDDKGKPIPGHNRAPAPFLPIIGSGYYDAPIRVAIYGMETACWHDLYRFVDKYDKGGLTAVKAYTDGIEGDDETYKKRFHNHHGTKYENSSSFGFWKFVYSTLAGIYGVDEKEDIRERPDLLRSFIWGNVNAYEKFEASCKKKGVKKADWKLFFDESERFNSAQLLLPYAKPQIAVVFYRGMTRKWLTGKEGKWQADEVISIDWSKFFAQHPKLKEEQQNKLRKYIRCYYLRYYLSETGTYVFKTMHPRGMPSRGIKSAIWKAAINYAIQSIAINK